MRRRLRTGAAITVGAALAFALVPAAEATVPACTEPASAAGEWSTYGADLGNSRSQLAETTIGPVESLDLEPAFVFQAAGAVNNTPIVDGGCVFVASPQGSSAGRVVALDADDGSTIWSTSIAVGTSAYAGTIVGSPALFGDLLLVPVNKRAAPFVLALNRSTGSEVWRTTLDGQHSSGTNAGLVVHDGIVFAGFFGAAGPSAPEHGGFVLLEAATGQTLAKTFSIPDLGTPDDPSDEGFEDGYGGAGIWATAAVDTATGFAYVGTSNPHSPQKLHPRSTSILKIDLRRASPTFGEIVDYYQGLRDTLVPGLEKNPACEARPDIYYAGSFSLTCAAIDVDFGASPNLIKLPDGRTMVGNLQKAGIYHIVDTADMTGASMTPVGPACFACNAASSAYADGRAFVAAGPPGELVAVDAGTGTPLWAGHLTSGLTYNAVSVANGVVWSVDSTGFLNGFEALTGAQLVKRRMQTDTGTSMASLASSSGIAIAHNTLYVAAARFVVAYRPAG